MSKQRYHILVVNTGSSSVRLALYRTGTAISLVAKRHESRDVDDAERLLAAFLQEVSDGPPDAVVHRVVHGGPQANEAAVVDPTVDGEIERCAPLAPLHNPRALHWIRVSRSLLGEEVPQVAVFDTAFFAELPDVARRYALPLDLVTSCPIRRYGFHGIAHRALWEGWSRRTGERAASRVISLQLGSGCSVAALRDGVPVDTSMGFSPNEGLVMATRSGDIDPGLLTWLQKEKGLDPAETERLLNEESGLLGLSGISGDMRELLQSTEREAQLAIEIFCYRARKYIGAYAAVLGGIDAILIGGGIGEHAPAIREGILRGMDFLGVHVDSERNRAVVGGEGRIDTGEGPVSLWVIPVDEEAELAGEGLRILESGQASRLQRRRL